MSDQGLPSSDAAVNAAGATPEGAAAPPVGAGAPRPARQAARKKASRGPTGAGGGTGGDEPPTPKTLPPIDDAQATRRGIIVIAVTVVVGLVIFFRGITQTTDPAVSTTAAVTTLAPFAPTSLNRDAAPPTTVAVAGTTLPKPVTTKVAPKDTKIVVANGVDPAKTIAGPVADKLTAAQYSVTAKVDLSTKTDKSAVYFSGELQGEAQAVAKALGWPETAAVALPKTPPTPLNGAQILVVVGTDRG